MNRVSIGSDNGLSPSRRQAIIKPMLGYCQLEPYEQTSVKFEYKIFHSQNAFENVVCEMAAILSGEEYLSDRHHEDIMGGNEKAYGIGMLERFAQNNPPNNEYQRSIFHSRFIISHALKEL